MANRDLRTILTTMPPDALSLLIKRLLAVAGYFLSTHGDKARNYQLTAHDVVSEVWHLALSGRRRCPSHVSLFTYLAKLASNVINHEARRPEHRLQRVDIDGLESKAGADVETMVLDRVDLAEFRESLSPELQAHLDLRESESGATDKQLAEKTGKTLQEILNLNRRLIRSWVRWSRRRAA